MAADSRRRGISLARHAEIYTRRTRLITEERLSGVARASRLIRVQTHRRRVRSEGLSTAVFLPSPLSVSRSSRAWKTRSREIRETRPCLEDRRVGALARIPSIATCWSSLADVFTELVRENTMRARRCNDRLEVSRALVKGVCENACATINAPRSPATRSRVLLFLRGDRYRAR